MRGRISHSKDRDPCPNTRQGTFARHGPIPTCGGSNGDLRSCNHQLAICSRDFAMEDTTTHSHRSCSGSREPVDNRRTTVWTTRWITVWITRCTSTQELVLARDSGSSASSDHLTVCRPKPRPYADGGSVRIGQGALGRPIAEDVSVEPSKGRLALEVGLRHCGTPSRTAPNTACAAKATRSGCWKPDVASRRGLAATGRSRRGQKSTHWPHRPVAGAKGSDNRLIDNTEH